MESPTETTAAQALEAARHFLSRWRDGLTRSAAEDLAQEAVLEAWERRDTLRHRDRWASFVRTISRRRRCRAIEKHLRLQFASLDADDDMQRHLAFEDRPPACFSVGARRVPLHWCLGELGGMLRRLGPLNERIVRSYYEGFSCRELAERYSLPEETVKVRLHRSRSRIRREFEGRIRCVFEPSDTFRNGTDKGAK